MPDSQRFVSTIRGADPFGMDATSRPRPTTLLHGGRLLDAGGRRDGAWVLLDGDTITAVGTGDSPRAGRTVDLAGSWLVPGFVDLHVHGGGGHAAEDGIEAMRAASEAHRRHGTTRSLVSLAAAPLADLESSLAAVADLAEADPRVLGAHLEGPFLAASRCGAHDPAHLAPPTPAGVDRLLRAARGNLRQVTIAPELPGGLDAVGRFAAAGATVAVGHTEADMALAARAFDAGARLLTHAFNAMPGLGHRSPGPVGAAFADPRVTLELVLDGQHVHPVVAGMLLAAAPGRVALVSDAMAAAGADDGRYRLGRSAVVVHGGRAVLEGTGTIAGSTLTLDRALRLAVQVVGADPVAAVTALTLTPARALGLEFRIGRLAPGYVADAVVLDDDWSVRAVWAAGRPVPV